MDPGGTGDGSSANATSPQHTSASSKVFPKRATKNWMRAGKSGGTGSGGGADGRQENQGAGAKEPVRNLDSFPGGDAMLEVLTRLQRLQETFSAQLQVSKLQRYRLVNYMLVYYMLVNHNLGLPFNKPE